ncbi:MAG: hypothetical protein KJ011_16475 [Burkholderiaceae bacterium]|nr:hypothetical protein [Burkholderiaceae bacterium]
MEISTRSVFQKTGKGIDELRTRSHGLGPRLRQLLILVDGRRDLDELARMLPGPGFAENLEQLESGGFVTRSPDAARPPDVSAAPAQAGSAPAEAGRAAAPRPTAPPRQPVAPAHGPELSALRTRVIRALLDTIGPNGDDFAIRIERARSVDELRALLPAVLSVVEACGGRKAVDGFLQRCGAL